MRVDTEDLCGAAEAAELAGVSRQTLANWRTRHAATFPQPVVKFAQGPIFRRSQVKKWLREYRPSVDTVHT